MSEGRTSMRGVAELAGAALLAIALGAHIWTRGDQYVALGLFGGSYCPGSGLPCESWSWTKMQVAGSMTMVSYALLASGLVTIVLALYAAITSPRDGAAGFAPRVSAAITAAIVVWFVLALRGAFGPGAISLGAGLPLSGLGLALIWYGARPAGAKPTGPAAPTSTGN